MAKTLNSLGSSSALFAALEKTRPGFVEQFYRDLAIRGSRGPGGGRRPPPPGRDGDPRRGNGFDRRNPSPRKPGVGGKNRRLDTLSIGYSSKAIEILDELIEQDPENASYRSTRSNCYCSLAAGLMKTDPTKADEMRDRAIEELEDLIKQDSKNYEYQFRLALACSLGDIESQSRGGEIKLLKKSVDIAQGLKKKFPQFLDYHYLDCFVQIKYAGRLTQEGKFENAFDSLKLALASLEHVSRLSPPDRTYRSTIATLSRQLRLFSVEAEAAGKEELARDASQLMNQLQKHRGFRPRGR